MSARKTLVMLLLGAAAARADGTGTSTTLFDSRPYVRDGTATQESPLFESFSLSARSEGNSWVQDLRLETRGWGRLTFGTPFDGNQVAGDVDSLFLEGRLLDRHVLVRVGRQLATGGAVRATQLDGLTARGIAAYGFGAEAYVGVPVQPRFAASPGDFLTGGRVFWTHAFDSEVGASYVYALRGGYLARSDMALDGNYTPIRNVTLSGLAQWSLAEGRLSEARLSALWQFSRKLQFEGDVQRTSPNLFIDRSSIFAVFAEEVRNEAGGEVVWRPLQPLSVNADWHWFRVEGGHGQRAGAKASFRTATDGTYGAELRFLDEPDNGYTQARVFAIRRLPHDLSATLDLDAYWLENEINSKKNSFTGTLTCAWAFRPRWDALLAASLASTPTFEQRTEVIARLVYKFDLPEVFR